MTSYHPKSFLWLFTLPMPYITRRGFLTRRCYKIIFFPLLLCLSSVIKAAPMSNNGYHPDYFQSVQTQISNLNIRAFCQDSLGYMWIATFRGLNRYNGYEFIQYFHDKDDSLSIDDDLITTLFLDSSHRLWIGTFSGVNRYDFSTNTFIKYPCLQGIAGVTSIYEDCTHTIWIGTAFGPARIDTLQHKCILEKNVNATVNLFMEDNMHRLWIGLNNTMGLACKNDNAWYYLPIPGNRSVTCMYSDPNGMWWLGTNDGLALFDPITLTFQELPQACLNNVLLNHTHINFIREIRPLQLLIGTESQGIFLYNILTQSLLYNEQQLLDVSGSYQLMTCYVDRQENVWIGTFDKGFTVWKRYLDYFNPDRTLSNHFRDKFVTRILEDVYGNLWISTRYHGLFHYTPSGKLTSYNAANSNLFKDNNYLIESLFIDSKNRLWIGLNEELLLCDFTHDGQLTIRSRQEIKGIGIMAEETNGRLWAGSQSGAQFGAQNGLYLVTADNRQFSTELIYRANVPNIYVLASGDVLFSAYGEGVFRIPASDLQPEKLQIPHSDAEAITTHCISLFEDSKGQIWMGSYSNGLLLLSENRCQIFTRNEGLPSNDVLCFREDKQGKIWFSTSNGISLFRATDSSFVNYFSNDGTLGNQFHEKAGLRHSDGNIFFSGNHGLTFFNPMAVLPNRFPPQVHLTDLKIMNRSEKPASQGSVLQKSIAYTNHITLNHNHSVVSFDYAGIDFLAPEKIRYVYKLEGFDKAWNQVGNFRRASYSNLAPGEYTFIVKAFNGDGVESLYPATLHITVKPAPWFSWPALFLYFILLASAALWLFRLLFRVKINKQLLEMEHSEREREKHATEQKMSFFTHISHELRTPLTLISAPLEQLLLQEAADTPGRTLLVTISRNVQRLLRLINQLLEFRKMESGIISVWTAHIDVIARIRSIQDLFIYRANEKQITLTFEPHVTLQEMWVDIDKLEKILYNLLSNALKYTPQKGSVEVFTQSLTLQQAKIKYPELKDTRCGAYLEVTVSDSGTGVPDAQLGELFVQYRRIKTTSDTFPDSGGSGIGLYYSKRLVEAHYGAILAVNQLGGGMAFSFVLPSEDIYADDEKEINMPVLPDDSDPDTAPDDRPTVAPKSTGSTCTILIVEDNIELMYFIRTLLERHYKLICASDGDEAWKITQHKSPDIILSDVLMSGISGFQLCKQVKQHPALCHIPVILLTARSAIEDQIEGLEQGADVYICKPFHVEYLLLTIANLLKNRESLRRFFLMPDAQKEVATLDKLNQIDQVFLNKLTLLLESELENTELDINTLSRSLGFSRTGFYRKLKGLTDTTPLDFLRNYRLKRAAEMIHEGVLSLTEVAEKTGFGTYSYFSVMFKKHFGISPKDYQ